ncbi:hypothetical protein OG568_59845 (plasmid) [Streptomyces sp. NBC_01450]|uniref:hypothetical protein n=1 Tax=Streptomyces sp. NBC_01450 TaxID=2903871 RepID=UPI002E329A94|nr:hypothetical protein [Streptomyces sp. NBC_01450]
MACTTGSGPGDAIKGFFDFLGDPIGTILQVIANKVLASAIEVFGDLTTGIPTLIADSGGTADKVNQQTQWIVVYTAVGSLIFAAGRMALERRGEAGAAALKGLLRVILVAGAATAVVTALASLSDRYADHLFANGAQQQLTTIGCSGGDGIPPVLLLVLAFLLLIAAIVQTVLLYIRLGVMIILLGTLPIAAAASMTNWGGGWWRKHIGWMVAWLLYKPAAGLVIFAGAAMLSNNGTGGVHEKIAGIGVLLLSALALPALLKLVVPATAALGAGGQGDTGAVVGALASGAKSIGGGSGSSGGASAMPGAAGPSGAAGGSGAAGAAGAGGARAAAAAGGPVGAAAAAAMTAGQMVGRMAAGAVEGANGDRGHNQ